RSVTNLIDVWEKDMVAFLLGCSVSFDKVLIDNSISISHEIGNTVPMYVTTIPCVKAGCFEGQMVVSMRPIPKTKVKKAVEVTAKYPKLHGTPVHIGSPKDIAIYNVDQPDYGKPVTIKS